MKNKTNKHDFSVFKEEFMLWVCEFGVLKGWEIEFKYCEFDENEPNTALADVKCLVEDRLVLVSFYQDWMGSNISNYYIRKTAFHESLEVLFEPLEHLVKPSCKKPARVEVHTLIKVFENTIFNESYIKRFGKIDSEYYNTPTLINHKNKKGGKRPA